MSSYQFNNVAYGTYANLSRTPLGSSCVLVPQQPLLTNPFEVDLEDHLEARNGSGLGKTKLCARGHWRPSEDAKLKELVAQFGPQNWNSIAEHFEARSGKSCRLRWFNQLDPRINRRAFTEDEETRLISAHSLYGNKWALISRLFPGRTDNAVKNHWHVMQARRQREESHHYRRHNPNLPRVWSLGLSNNGSNGLTNSSIINDSSSTCTNISFTPSLRPIFRPSYNYNNLVPVQNHVHGSLMGLSRERRVQAENIGFGKVFGSWIGPCQIGSMEKLKAMVEQRNYSDSNSGVSVSESVYGNEKMDDMVQVPFIDFLGVGAA
ncbi:hypothetical protein Lal_00033307 [Lupinus albus]|uniref:Putative transcription factor MYB-HB-like family n=1 Tax=Lupinus albus TaxID=3870 RepID=A0A6A5N3E8_LUPAL|nr:putative transcription factor MYB-HB-like family [Lupinus albus]KAF1879649.1 hypothetical protein Lal_00033307 [Lupinus albus]